MPPLVHIVGATKGEVKHELQRLLLDVPYWFEWCAQGKVVWYA